MTTPLKPTREQLSAMAGGDQRVLRALEDIFDKTVPQTDEAYTLAVQANDRLDNLVLDDLVDVDTTVQSDGNVMAYDQSSGLWVPKQYLKGIRFGAGADYTTFESDGTMVANGAATTFIDIDFPIIIRTVGPNIPTLVAMQGTIPAPQWAVNDTNPCEGQEIIHTWKEATDAFLHIHTVTNGLDATDRYLKYTVEWCWGDYLTRTPLSAAATITSAELLIPANTPDKTPIVFDIGTITLTGGHIAAHVWARLTRIASVGAAPTNNPWCSMLQLHIEQDTMGSRQQWTK